MSLPLINEDEFMCTSSLEIENSAMLQYVISMLIMAKINGATFRGKKISPKDHLNRCTNEYDYEICLVLNNNLNLLLPSKSYIPNFPFYLFRP